ncbi:MAG: O-antigen ligase family protein [Oscillospiraceae bacterium]|nr:O-antigen ligase family protein [Oscillospiraceae bacterium]
MLKSMDSSKSAIIERLPNIVLIYCILQPILDIVGFWQMQLEIGNTVTMAIRMVLLGGSVFLGFFLSDRKRYYVIMLGILALLTALHGISNIPGGYTEPVTDFVNLARIYLMPMTTVAFITFLRCGRERVLNALKNGMLINSIIIIAVEIISVITNTDRETYRHEHIGILGWFFWANSQSAILSMLAPIVICWALKRWKEQILPVVLCTVAAEATLYFFGTRLTFGALLASGVGVSVCLLFLGKTRRKQALSIFLVTLAFLLAYPVSPTAKRMQAVWQINSENEQSIVEQHITLPSEEIVVPTDNKDEPRDPNEEPQAPNISQSDWEKLKKIYRGYLAGVVERFGYERVMKKYNYTLDASILGDWRIEKLSFCELLMEDAPFGQHLFGINLQDMRMFVENGILNEHTGQWEDGYKVYDVENDFHGIYFLLGIVGLILIIGFLLWFGGMALLRVCKDFETAFTVDMVGFAGGYVFGLLHAYFTVSVLRRNNASVYMAFILAGLWYLSQKKNSLPVEEKTHETH